MFKIAVLVSGGGTNLQSIIDHIQNKQLNAEIVLVVSSSQSAFALERAKKHNIETVIISKKEFSLPNDEILKLAINHNVDLIVLAGYMGILSGDLLKVYRNRIINIHPSYIPNFCGPGMYGIHVHEAVIKAKAKFSGATVHYVNDTIDGGKIIIQDQVPVLEDDTPAILAKRVLQVEHKILPQAIKMIIEHKEKA
ncbi:MAG: phosphoribosylglycinamide formyltransferase [Mycoplasmataceae bacterium]|nr:phosphoribosylglycinamide formyltransferase [Mycoplasmataceae bacterium]